MPPPVANHLPGTLHPLTLKQLLQAPLAPLPPKELSGAGGEEEEQDPMPHTSSKNNFKYVPVDPKCLTMLADMKVQKFCEYINALSGFATFPDCMKQPFSASTINNEGDVNAYLESQVVIPTWEAVIRMFPPSHRDYDLLNRRQFSIEEGRPDLVFGSKVLDESGYHVFTPRAVLELKRPKIVEGLLPVFVNHLYRKHKGPSELPDDWATVMQQLRKYAIQSACSHILVMDQRVGLYLDFDNAVSDNEDVNFLLSVPPELINDENRLIAPHCLTLRELLAFMCYRAFGNVHQLRTIPVQDSATTVPVDCEHYSSSLPPDVSSKNRKHSLPDNPGRRQQPKRSVNSSASRVTAAPAVFAAWIAGTVITLQLVTHDQSPAPPPSTRPRAVSKADSGFHEAVSPRRHGITGARSFDPPLLPEGTSTITFTVSNVFTRAAALLVTPAGKLYVAKLFSPLHTRNAHELLANELAAYAAAFTLQGREIPYFYGRWAIPDTSHLGVILTEYIDPGLTIAHLRTRGEWARIHTLSESAEMAVMALHRKGVRHGDLVARNLQVSICAEGERVVVVDFDVARVEGTEGEGRRWADWVFLRNAFRQPHVDNGTAEFIAK